MLKELVDVIWIVLPAYIANGAPVVAAKLLSKLGLRRHPIDFGKNFLDGKRIFGDSKSWEGLVSGVMGGVLTGFIQSSLTNNLIVKGILTGFVLGLGAMMGDLIGAFIKRRLGLRPGEPLPLVDQLLFLVVALYLGISCKLIVMTYEMWLYALVLTLLLHILTNYIAYLLKLKNVPW